MMLGDLHSIIRCCSCSQSWMEKV
ncbi:hypothetical protein OIU79_030445, partial [Salix purpurea]